MKEKIDKFMKKIKICVFKNKVLYTANSVLYHEPIEKNFVIAKIFCGFNFYSLVPDHWLTDSLTTEIPLNISN